MTTFAQWRSPSSRLELARLGRKPKKYDLRIVDQFYVYSQALARTERHRDEAYVQSQHATKRTLWTILVTGSFLFYYVMDRIQTAMSLL